jgi:signal transduction histidine kinase
MSWTNPMSVTSTRNYHPLEIIPFFRRFPCTPVRDLIYTFIWSSGFGVVFYLLGAMGEARMPSLYAFGVYLLISNCIGYSIHGLFRLGRLLGLDEASRRGGFVWKVVYFTVVPLAGVFLGFMFTSLFVDIGLGEWITRPAAFISVVTTSLVISTVLSVIFFWRERSAVAEATVARERERSERIEREALAANLRALQAQIEPHFLFNTLANVSSLIDSDPAKARRMMDSFIRFLRASLAATRMDATTLGAERDLIAAYLDILQIRMGTRLRYRIEIDPALDAFELPPMLLQPVIENAIRHGLEPKVEGGEVVLRARRDGDRVVIEILDSGVGFSPTTRGGVGLTNLRDRLKLLYGERAALAIGENGGGGAAVTVALPA